MGEGRAEALLKSALEKIVYFEARSEQLQGDAATLRVEGEQLRRELASATQREVELRRRVAELEVEVGRAHREREEAGRVVDAMRSERTALLEKVLEASRISGHAADGGPDYDLAAFIAELRAEALAARGSSSGRALPGEPAVAQVAGRRETAPVFAGSPLSRQASPLSAQSPAFGRPGSGPGPRVESVPAQASTGTMVAGRPVTSVVATAPSASSGRPEPAVQPELAGQQQLVPAPVAPNGPEGQGGPPQNPEAPFPALVRSAALAVTREAERLAEQGRLGVPSSPRFVEESLFGFSVRELASPDPAARCRAAERLRTLGDRAAAPAVAAALHAERDERVLASLLDTFRTLASREGASVVAPLLGASSPGVRIAALRAVTTLDPDAAAAHLARAAHDPDASVRRRASLLAVSLGPERVLELQREAAGDPDPEVRRLVVLATGAAGGEAARSRLLTSLDDEDLGVRRAAARSLSRLLGVELGHVPELGDEERRREIRRLSTLEPAPLAVRAESAAARLTLEVDPLAPEQEPVAEKVESSGSPGDVEEARATAVGDPEREVESAGQAGPSVHSDEALCQRIAQELRSAMRGRTIPDLATQLGVTSEQLVEAAALLTARGQVVRRGAKLFVS